MTDEGDGFDVLLVDDDRSLLDMAATFLARSDDRFTIHSTTDPEAAITRLGDTDVDCIVSDYEMPEMNGIEFLETVREDHEDLPFILYTGKGSEEVAAEAIDAGVTSYFRKERSTDHFRMLADRIRNHVEQYRTKHRIETLREEYELVAETATDVFWTVDLDTGEQTLSDGIQQFGYDPDGIDPDLEWWYERLHPDDRDRIRAKDDALAARDESVFDDLSGDRGWFSNEYRWRRTDGTYAHCSERGIVVFEDDEPVKMVGTITDVTDQKQRKQELKKARNRMEIALEATDSVVWDTDLETGEITYYPSSETLYGAKLESIDDFLDQVHRDDRQRVSEAIDHGFESGSYSVEFRTVRDGEVRWIADMGRIEHDADGTPIRGTGVGRDCTERKRRKRELERKTERLDQFASVVVHELRNPLNVAAGNLDLLRADRDSVELEEAEAALARAERILEETLRLAREGQVVDEMEPVELTSVVAACWQNVSSDSGRLAVDTEDEIRADRDRFKQILENLFRNAIEHGGESVTVRVGDLEDGFFVEDDGAGIPEAERERVFEPGYTDGDGIGFGLTLVRQISEAHGWDVHVCDGQDGGTRFEFTGVSGDPPTL